jgi:uncharacterized radical SAM protein YgiQ
MDARGWDVCDVILVTGDAYIDHPSFGTALIGRFLESLGYRVGIIARPDYTSVEAFQVLGAPRLFWGVSAGNLDSNLARLTVMRKIRRDDPYAPGGVAGGRPANASIVYTSKVRQAAKGVPVILGGLEASLRRWAYYDYWTDKVRRSILPDAKADLIAYGMAERSVAEIAARLRDGRDLQGIPGTAEMVSQIDPVSGWFELPAYEEVAAPTEEGRTAYARMAREIHQRTGTSDTLIQKHGSRWVVVHPPSAPLSSRDLDNLYALPFTRRPHPAYAKNRIPAYDMIRDSITTHRGCYGGCAFCAIGAHQGKAIISRSTPAILDEIRRCSKSPDFHGTISDLGGPTANMYGTSCGRREGPCSRASCLYPEVCASLKADQRPARELLVAARQLPGIRHLFVTSGIRFDLLEGVGGVEYFEELVRHHICGRLKIAPEHAVPQVLAAMRKPPPEKYRRFVEQWTALQKRHARHDQLNEYYISGHPGCSLADMIELARLLKRMGIRPEQVQDFYPVPLSLAGAMYYTGQDPLTGVPVPVARTDREKALQRAILLCHLPEFQAKAREALREAGRTDLIGRGPEALVPPGMAWGQVICSEVGPSRRDGREWPGDR